MLSHSIYHEERKIAGNLFFSPIVDSLLFPYVRYISISGVNMKRILDSEKQNIIGPRIKEARMRAGISQKQLSEKLELLAVYTCRGSISRIENGQRAVTDIEIDAISKILKVSLDSLFGRE